MRYVVLRASEPLDKGFESMRPGAWREPTRSRTELEVATVDADAQNRGELHADPRNACVVDADILLSLVAPQSMAACDVSALSAHGPARMPDGIAAVGAHTSTFTGEGVTVAVLDTGCNLKHPVFQGKEIARRNFLGGAKPDDVTDDDGHGTHCAGIVCGAPVDGVRVGVAPGVTKLCIGKVIGAGSTLEAMLKGMYWAVIEQRAQVVSMSLGYDLPGNTRKLIDQYKIDPTLATQQVLRQQSEILRGVSTLCAYLASQSRNVVFVAASGNESKRDASPPFILDAGLPADLLFAVGAVGTRDAGNTWSIAPFSNGRVQVVAPGVDIVSAHGESGWQSCSGTSMATPHVAGVAALWVEKLRRAGQFGLVDIVRTQLIATAKSQRLTDQHLGAIGAGMVQAPQ